MKRDPRVDEIKAWYRATAAPASADPSAWDFADILLREIARLERLLVDPAHFLGEYGLMLIPKDDFAALESAAYRAQCALENDADPEDVWGHIDEIRSVLSECEQNAQQIAAEG